MNPFKTILYVLILIIINFSCLNAELYYISSDDSDAEERMIDGDMSLGSSDLEMAYDTGDSPDRGLQIIGLRFNAVNIPVGSTITSAKIRFRADNDDGGVTSLVITGELSDDSASFGSSNYNLSSRTNTSSSVVWNPTSWSNNSYYETVDISSVVQEIVNQAGYAGDDLTIFITPGAGCTDSSCRRRADSRNESSSDAARLEITYSVAEAPPIIGNIPDQTAFVGTSFSLNIASYVTLTNGDAITSYTLTGGLPAWLSFNSTTGVLSGTPSTAASAITFSVTATDNDGVSNAESFTVTVSPALTETTGGREFTQREQQSLFGDVKVIGNTVLCILSGGSCAEPTNSNSNAGTDLQKAPQSYSTLTLPVNSTIEYARIYWQGRKNENDTWDAASKISAGTIGVRKGASGAFTSVSADIKDFDTTTDIPIYSASADASGVVDGSGTYYIDTTNFYTITGDTPDGLGAYGAWTLVVIYKDPNEASARNITIFDGYKRVTSSSGNVDITVNGFLTPRTGLVDSKTYVFTAEGDKYIDGDHLKMAGATYNTTLQDLYGDNAFDSRVDVDGTRNPNLSNNNGIDIHKYDTGTTSGARNIITNNETGAKFQFTSTGDTYFPSLIVFSTELYLPQMCYDYSIKQDGAYLSVDRDAYPVAHLDSTISSSDLEIVVYLRNQEADILAEGIALKADVNETMFDQVGNIYTSHVNGSALIDRGTPTSTNPLCDYDEDGDNSLTNNGCTDGHDIRKGNGSLDAGDYIYTKYKLSPNSISGLGSIDEPLGLSVRYYITAGGNKIVYPDYLLGGVNIPLCPPSGAYQPAWGQFNVVKSGQTDPIYNNLSTQISRNPFDVAVVFDSTPGTGNNEAPVSDINTTVLVEMIDIDAFGDINASCANPDSSLSEPIFVPITFTNSNYQANVTTQTADYYNFAVKNAAFRVWYFSDQNGTLIQNWHAATTDSSKTLSSISGLYNSGVHAQCSASCSDATSAACFTCIKENYAQPLCSRDNFSVRPESYDLRIYDVNKSLPAYNLATDPTNTKNTTKIDISTQDGYTPVTSPVGRMNLAAGYNYRYDVTATGHDGISLVPGYTRYFNGASDYNTTLIWDPQTVKTGCNDTDNRNIPFYVANGIMQNEERNHQQIGEYKLNIIDTSWTAVDWLNMTHHDITASGGFLSGDDCITGSTTSIAVGGQHGCTINTNHGSDGGGRTYKDHDLTFHPYRFDMGAVVASRGVDDDTTFDANSYIYMSDLSIDDNMSFHLFGSISANAENNSTSLSNFVENCYAQPVNLTINKSSISGAVAYQSSINTFDINNTTNLLSPVIPTPTVPWIKDMNDSIQSIWTVPVTSFDKGLSGSIRITQNLNFDRNLTIEMNPEQLTFTTYDINCTTPANCRMNADLDSAHETEGYRDLNRTDIPNTRITLKHYYGRTHASRQRYIVPDDAPYTANIYYEVFCFGTINGNTCSQALLQNPTGILKRTDDIRWYINENHTFPGDGDVGTVVEKDGLTNVTQTSITNIVPVQVQLTYDASKGYPYKTTMENNASTWLIYNKDNPTATRNEFAVEFERAGTGWSGEHETDTTTKDIGSVKANRRTNW